MRWLEIQGRHDKVIDELKKIANINKRPLPDFCSNTQVEVLYIYIYIYFLLFTCRIFNFPMLNYLQRVFQT